MTPVVRDLRIGILAMLLATSSARAANPDSCPPLYRSLNETAHRSFATYASPTRPNDRPLHGTEGYNAHLRADLQTLVGEGDEILDIGGGRGVAALELAQERKAFATVINTQEPDLETQKAVLNSQGRLTYQQGWAEEELLKHQNKFKLALDVYGAYSYSVEKVRLIELEFRALIPGGQARIIIPENSPAFVVSDVERRSAWVARQRLIRSGRRYLLGEIDDEDPGILPLHEWLVIHHPKLFQLVAWPGGRTQVLVIRKPPHATELDLQLRLIEISKAPHSELSPLAPVTLFAPTSVTQPQILLVEPKQLHLPR